MASNVEFYVHGLLPVDTKQCHMDKTKYDYSKVTQNSPLQSARPSSNSGYYILQPSSDGESVVKHALAGLPYNFETHPFVETDKGSMIDGNLFDMNSTQFGTYTVTSVVGSILLEVDKHRYHANVLGKPLGNSDESTKPMQFFGSPCDWDAQWFDLINGTLISTNLQPPLNPSGPPSISSFYYILRASTAIFDITKILTDLKISDVPGKMGRQNPNQERGGRPIDFNISLKYGPLKEWVPETEPDSIQASVKIAFSQNRIEVRARAIKKSNGSSGAACFDSTQLKALLAWTYGEINTVTSAKTSDVPKYWMAQAQHLDKPHTTRALELRGWERQRLKAKKIQKLLLDNFKPDERSNIKASLLHDMTQFQGQSKSNHREFGYRFFPMI